ncbi:CPBP family intramembrane glutamic endopeptidase [Stackebrandtia nassauensis]|uniref:Abortive infection protein n=1 Tax=Stackebrandtia nassauensis (strain DSM 44728 / CIP 108903 / NRRL B-16338 / NBRC 102104 / LLR-40K-21) TaxID=446470 RepID=D3PUL3_STANL|nr:CPBP family intramembrane glutamic endopeptidase [Stackebrandtia nassauensis]ADD43026.1 Abortive infection protein [Stackebrandtia nassauensis DSM 44728]
MRLLKQLVAIAAVSFLGGQAVYAVSDNKLLTLFVGLAVAVAALATYAWVVRWSERRKPVAELAANRAAAGIGWGTLIGAGLFALVIFNIAFLEGYHVNGRGSIESAVALFGFMAAAAVTEELLWRGVLFRIVEQRIGTWIALTLTGLAFGLVHLVNPNANLWGAIAIAIEAGGMLTAAYVATRSLWLPIGLHFGWNFAASGIFSTEVSGNGTPQGLLDASTSGPVILTGGDFGPEGSLYSVVFCVLATVVFLWLARRRGNLVPLRRSARAEAPATLSR